MASIAGVHSDYVPIEDPDFYINDPWPTFAWMQAEQPFYYYAPLNTFVLTRYKDIRDVSVQPNLFVNSRGTFLNDIKYKDRVQDSTITDSFFPKDGEQVGTTDPPRHQDLRRVIMPAFSIPAMEALHHPITSHITAMLDAIEPGKPVEWMDYAAAMPITAACHLIGLPATDHKRVQYWSDELEKLGGDLTFEQINQAAQDFQSLQSYIVENVERRKAERDTNGVDLLSVLLNAELDNDKVTMGNVVMFAMTAMAAGSDTTRAMLGGIVRCFADNPDQWTLLRENRKLVGNAIEEVIRWVTPARAFLRVAVEDTEVNGHQIKEGQALYLMYMAANRDETAFVNAGKFDATRKDASRHLAFGAGPHLCAGMRLARMEGAIMLNALLDRFSKIELAGTPQPVRHIIRNSWSSLPATFTA
ncbi:MAG: Steroid C26-monooxygenase [Nitrospira sp. OLB3]|nr:MAG: Steroid C26-monooxygenase [Nitrospira sp. OLB3]